MRVRYISDFNKFNAGACSTMWGDLLKRYGEVVAQRMVSKFFDENLIMLIDVTQ